ncbi:MAG: hypothetical protein MJ250_09900 [Alphaproteobacteria bacterium]|nr:hypothetical protein [Alphaproteobacteria bacterium]
MEKEIKLVPEQETKDNEIVELKDDDMSTITAGARKHGSRSHKIGGGENALTIHIGPKRE